MTYVTQLLFMCPMQWLTASQGKQGKAEKRASCASYLTQNHNMVGDMDVALLKIWS